VETVSKHFFHPGSDLREKLSEGIVNLRQSEDIHQLESKWLSTPACVEKGGKPEVQLVILGNIENVPSKMSICTLKIDHLYPQKFYPHESSLSTLKKFKMYPHYLLPSKTSICTLIK